MKLHTVRIKNFRSLQDVTIQIGGRNAFVIGECAVGKTTLLAAIYRALGRDGRLFERADFHDLDQAIEVELDLSDFNADQTAALRNRIDFATKRLAVGVRVVWDESDEAVVVEHGFPKKSWAKSTQVERNAFDVQWLPANRDISKYLQFGLRNNLIAQLIKTLNIQDAIDETSEQLHSIANSLGKNPQLKQLLENARTTLGKIIPNVSKSIFEISSYESTDQQILRLLGLLVSYYSESIEVERQSSGLSQLVVLSFMAELAKSRAGTLLLIDQPEMSLHPQPQRSFVRALQELPCQWLICTHSSNILDRCDPRTIVRLNRSGTSVIPAQPASIGEEEAKRFARYTTPQTAEAFFARIAILVEGISDVFALVALADKQGRNLDAEGVSIVDMDGAGGLKTFLGLLGPSGFRLRVVGMCDADKASEWMDVLAAAGLIPAKSIADMNTAGFFVCSKDLEDELVTAYGERTLVSLIDSEGEKDAFTLFCSQPSNKGKAQGELCRAFISKRGRKVRYAPLIIERLDSSKIPKTLFEVLAHAKEARS